MVLRNNLRRVSYAYVFNKAISVTYFFTGKDHQEPDLAYAILTFVTYSGKKILQ